MAERRVVNKYYPPDYDPKLGSLNKYRGHRPLGSREKGIERDGTLVVRFALPLGVWCAGCNTLVAKGTRFNAKKKLSGEYLGIKKYTFSVKCPNCRATDIGLETNLEALGYRVLYGGRPQALSRKVNAALPPREGVATENAFSKAEAISEADNVKELEGSGLKELRSVQKKFWEDDIASNKRLRAICRDKKANDDVEGEMPDRWTRSCKPFNYKAEGGDSKLRVIRDYGKSKLLRSLGRMAPSGNRPSIFDVMPGKKRQYGRV